LGNVLLLMSKLRRRMKVVINIRMMLSQD